MRRQYKKLRSMLLISEKAAKITASRFEDEGSQNNNNWKMSELIRRVEITLCPSRVLGKLGDAYVDMMLCLAANVAHLNNGNVFLAQRFFNTTPSSSAWNVKIALVRVYHVWIPYITKVWNVLLIYLCSSI